jgi:hypothetical protein
MSNTQYETATRICCALLLNMRRLYNPLPTHTDFLSIPANQTHNIIKQQQQQHSSFVIICCTILVKETLHVYFVKAVSKNIGVSLVWIHFWLMVLCWFSVYSCQPNNYINYQQKLSCCSRICCAILAKILLQVKFVQQ